MLESSRLKPVEYLGVYRSRLFSRHIWPILEIVVLPLLLCFQIEPGKTSKVLLTDSLIDGCTSSDSLSIIVGGIGPPISLSLHISDYHVLYRQG